MGVYIGYVDRKGYEPTIFFNFKPIAEITESQITVLSDSALEELLPESQKRNIDVRQYSDYDKGVLMTCVNIAAAMSDIINIPVVDEAGKLCVEAENLLITGEKHLAQLEQCINQ